MKAYAAGQGLEAGLVAARQVHDGNRWHSDAELPEWRLRIEVRGRRRVGAMTPTAHQPVPADERAR